MANWQRIKTQLRRNKFMMYGLPMFILVIAGSFGLKEFTELKYNIRDEKIRTLTAEEKLALHQKGKKKTLEENTMKELDIEHWVNKRGPRPWESKADRTDS
ncbi:Cytochrome c oxidase assembly protein COX16-like protein, mitochondrial [Trichoplax sp. H2]|nr:Cytochrome c oxidase assembly protein COX16-like protein, mitochondrial [Trichoplax sp. H2]|eukprot:RDD47357.1 Cytochrome c oxidase assembly protein COX16-like protein, mitochondrial [Trichoplax sp. H2]